MEKKYEEIATYFTFDPKKIPMEEFFGDLTTFIKEFEVCIAFFVQGHNYLNVLHATVLKRWRI